MVERFAGEHCRESRVIRDLVIRFPSRQDLVQIGMSLREEDSERANVVCVCGDQKAGPEHWRHASLRTPVTPFFRDNGRAKNMTMNSPLARRVGSMEKAEPSASRVYQNSEKLGGGEWEVWVKRPGLHCSDPKLRHSPGARNRYHQQHQPGITAIARTILHK